jgi:hypothetical protein
MMFLKITNNNDVKIGTEKNGLVKFSDGTTYSADSRGELTKDLIGIWLNDVSHLEPDEYGIPRRPPSDGEKETFLEVMTPYQRERWVKKWGAEGYSQLAWENYIAEHPEHAPDYLSDVRIEQELDWWRNYLKRERYE